MAQQRGESFPFLYDVLRALAVIQTLVYLDHCRAWFIHGFVLKTEEEDTCPHTSRQIECPLCGGAAAVSPPQLYDLYTRLREAVERRECIARGKKGVDGLPVVVEYDPLCSSDVEDWGCPRYRHALKRAEEQCWDVWDGFVETVRFNICARAARRR